MLIRFGYDIGLHCDGETVINAVLRVHTSRAGDLCKPDTIRVTPDVPQSPYQDEFGNRVVRLVVPAGDVHLAADGIVIDRGLPDTVNPTARWLPIQELPAETLTYLRASRYCNFEELIPVAWQLFGQVPAGWERVQAVCSWVHANIRFGYGFASPLKTALDVYRERTGVCRDFAHLAISLCRALNIPARYATGYLGDIGEPPDPAPMDFCAWFEACLDGQWYTFDARYNRPRIGRVLIARGRDAADVAMLTTFGTHRLTRFDVHIHQHIPSGKIGLWREEGAAREVA